VSGTAQVELNSGRVSAPAVRAAESASSRTAVAASFTAFTFACSSANPRRRVGPLALCSPHYRMAFQRQTKSFRNVIEWHST